jgi:hypothetical protein
MIVAGLVLEDGGDETQAIAALLHDAAEDGGDRPMLDRIRAEFGDAVADIVEACSDTLDSEDPRSWRERKARYLAHLPDVTDQGTLRAALADKVHNARSIVRDYRAEGHTLWERFTNKTIDDQLWYYQRAARLLQHAACRPACGGSSPCPRRARRPRRTRRVGDRAAEQLRGLRPGLGGLPYSQLGRWRRAAAQAAG